MEFIKKFKGNILILAIFLIALISVIFMNIFSTRYIHYINIIIAIVPVILYSVSFYIAVKQDKIVKWTRFSNLFNLVIFLSLTVINFTNMSFKESSVKVENPKNYKRILKLYKHDKNDMIKHFPNQIPKNAKEIKFSEHPQFLIGEAEMYLTYELSKSDFNELYENFKKDNYKSINLNDIKNEEKNIPSEVKQFLSQYKNEKDMLFLIDSQEYNNSEDTGKSYGIAFNFDNNRVMYWSENW